MFFGGGFGQCLIERAQGVDMIDHANDLGLLEFVFRASSRRAFRRPDHRQEGRARAVEFAKRFVEPGSLGQCLTGGQQVAGKVEGGRIFGIHRATDGGDAHFLRQPDLRPLGDADMAIFKLRQEKRAMDKP